MSLIYEWRYLILFIIAVVAVKKMIGHFYYRQRAYNMRRRSASSERIVSGSSTAYNRSQNVQPIQSSTVTDTQPRAVHPGIDASPVSTNLEQTDPVDYYANVRHGSKDNWFRFQYKKVGKEWRAYILRMPDLNGRDSSLHRTHRYKNGEQYWICYDPQPTTLKDILTISRAWADRELEYIATGVPFEDQTW